MRTDLEDRAEAELAAAKTVGTSSAERVRHLDLAAVYAALAEEEGRRTIEEAMGPRLAAD